MKTVNNLEMLPKYVSDMINTHGLQKSIELTQKHLAVAGQIDAHRGAIEFLTTVRDELNRLKEND